MLKMKAKPQSQDTVGEGIVLKVQRAFEDQAVMLRAKLESVEFHGKLIQRIKFHEPLTVGKLEALLNNVPRELRDEIEGQELLRRHYKPRAKQVSGTGLSDGEAKILAAVRSAKRSLHIRELEERVGKSAGIQVRPAMGSLQKKGLVKCLGRSLGWKAA
jgi:hypothetical protein